MAKPTMTEPAVAVNAVGSCTKWCIAAIESPARCAPRGAQRWERSTYRRSAVGAELEVHWHVRAAGSTAPGSPRDLDEKPTVHGGLGVVREFEGLECRRQTRNVRDWQYAMRYLASSRYWLIWWALPPPGSSRCPAAATSCVKCGSTALVPVVQLNHGAHSWRAALMYRWVAPLGRRNCEGG